MYALPRAEEIVKQAYYQEFYLDSLNNDFAGAIDRAAKSLGIWIPARGTHTHKNLTDKLFERVREERELTKWCGDMEAKYQK